MVQTYMVIPVASVCLTDGHLLTVSLFDLFFLCEHLLVCSDLLFLQGHRLDYIPTPTAMFSLIKSPISKYCHPPKPWRLGLQYINSKRTQHSPYTKGAMRMLCGIFCAEARTAGDLGLRKTRTNETINNALWCPENKPWWSVPQHWQYHETVIYLLPQLTSQLYPFSN